jgi:hypothetical protein
MALFTHFVSLAHHIDTTIIIVHFLHSLDHVLTELKSEDPTEQSQAEYHANPELAQGKLRYMPPILFDFSFKSLSLC